MKTLQEFLEEQFDQEMMLAVLSGQRKDASVLVSKKGKQTMKVKQHPGTGTGEDHGTQQGKAVYPQRRNTSPISGGSRRNECAGQSPPALL